MASSNSSLYLPILSLILLTILSSTKPTISIPISATNFPDSNPAVSVHDVLKSHGLPIGLFPKSISDFSLDPLSGRFQLHVTNSPCDAKFETHVRYDWNVSGTISYGRISELSGVSAQELFLWLPVMGIQVDIPSSGLIYFDVGVVSKQFSLSFFETPHDCAAAAVQEGGAEDRDRKFSPPIDLSFLRGSGRIIENPSEKHLNGHYEGHVGNAVS